MVMVRFLEMQHLQQLCHDPEPLPVSDLALGQSVSSTTLRVYHTLLFC
jgi:hypothetical protein